MNKLGIDVRTKDKARLMARLRGLVSTVSVQDGGTYHEDPSYSQVWLDTSKTEGELDAWLYGTKGIEYVGTFERKSDEES